MVRGGGCWVLLSKYPTGGGRMAVSFDHPLGQTSDGTGGKCSSLLSCLEKWEIVSAYIYIQELKSCSLRDEKLNFLLRFDY